MATQAQTSTKPGPVEAKIQKLREIFADANDLGKKALENVLKELKEQVSKAPPPPIESAGRQRRPQTRIWPSSTYRSASGQGLGADLHRETETRRRKAAAGAAQRALDVLFCDAEGYPGMHSPAVRDWIASNQITADVKQYLIDHQITAEGWFVAEPDLTLAEIERLQKIGKAVDELLDKIG